MPGNRRTKCSLVPSPPNSPRKPVLAPPERRPERKASAPPVLEQHALSGEVREFVPPDHTYGESFPGRQAPTTQLSLFEAGVVVKLKT